MDNLLVMMALLGKPEESLWRLLAPLLTIIGIAVFGWLNEKAKQKERQQQEEEDARQQREEEGRAPGARSREAPARGGPSGQAGGGRGARASKPIYRYQPQIPSAPGRVGERGGRQAGESELIIVADDISAEASGRDFRHEQQRRLRDEAIRRARAIQAQHSREDARKAKPQSAPAKIQAKPSRKLPALKDLPKTEVSEYGIALVCPGQTISSSQIRRAIVWAEILGAPRALRGYSDPSDLH